jgi:hypothetical protein
MDDRVREVMMAIVEQLRAYVEGDEEALAELTEVLDSDRYEAEVVEQAFEMVVRALEPLARDEASSQRDGRGALAGAGPDRALLLTNPAYGYLFGLLESGRVTPEQFEEIMVRAKEMGNALDTEHQAKELATDVLIRWFDDENGVAADISPSAWVH